MLSLVLFPTRRWRCRQRAADSTEQSCTKIPFCFGKCLIQLISVYILHFHPAHRVASIIGLSATNSRLQFPKGWKPSVLVPNFLRLKHFELKFFQELEKPSCPVFYVDCGCNRAFRQYLFYFVPQESQAGSTRCNRPVRQYAPPSNPSGSPEPSPPLHS